MMASKEELKEMFDTGKKPTGDNFAELIDGVKGDKGSKGDKGEPGTDGKDGSKGDTGASGADGKDAENQFTEDEVAALKALVEDDEG